MPLDACTTILLRNGLLATYTGQDAPLSVPLARRVDVLIEGDRIVDVAEPNSLKLPQYYFVIDCSNKWVAPGFVDTHRHMWMTIVNDQEDWTLSEYLAKLSWTTAALVSAEDVYIGQLAGCLQALHSGTTTVVDHFHCANSVDHIEQALRATAESGLRSMFCISRQSLPTSIDPLLFEDDKEVSEMQVDTIRRLATEDKGRLTADGRVTLGMAYDVQGYDPAEDSRILSTVRALGVKPITLHYVGGPHARSYSKKVRAWADAGLLKNDVIFSHGNDLMHKGCDPGEWTLLKQVGASIASTPEDELGMGHGNPVTYEAVRRGVKTGLGIDCASVTSTEMFPAMRFALQWERGRIHETLANEDKSARYNALSAASAFRLATLGGAEASGRSTQIGSVEVGKLADIVLYDAESVNLAHCRDPYKGIVFHATAADVEWVIVNGEIVKREGKLVKKEWPEVGRALQRAIQSLQERLDRCDLDDRYATAGKFRKGQVSNHV
ncbi:Metallo-dependent hydrolase [Neolentinus lepideus HHB14362 ss-1]|uniref:Metallo-dependent hydrolase n=1 Tax=Neolentinus lepideus HHB14362 ss-1 TaxID=1314782 RepID=A0A165SR77_9AGAM|nr:Metallo-dependent hydrolase [Neolentinus lepideus HHB14362 ss-1]